MSNNWVNTGANTVSVKDKLKQLLSMADKLVLVQVHELERIKAAEHKHRGKMNYYIENLYVHYVERGLSKTYMN